MSAQIEKSGTGILFNAGNRTTQEKVMTEGEYLVGKSFNPGGLDSVNEIKQKAADLIDCIGRHGVDGRTRALAITAIETGAMWGVKSATKPPRED